MSPTKKTKSKVISEKEKTIYIHSKISVLIILFIIASIAAGWSFLRLQSTIQKIQSKNARHSEVEQSSQQYYDLIESVQRHIVVVSGEVPFVAVVGDSEVARNLQPFFSSAITGDAIIMYSDKAILFRPSEDKIVNIGPVLALNYSGDNKSEQLEEDVVDIEQDKPRQIITLDIRNGSQVPGRARATANNLEQLNWYDPINVDNADNYQYPQTLIINLGDVDTSELEELYGVRALIDLPVGEVESEADVVIILGNENEQ